MNSGSRIALPDAVECGEHADERGRLRHCNAFDMSAVRRFYTISNSPGRPVRGWFLHKRETKWFWPVCGRTVLCATSRPCESVPPPPDAVKRIVLDASAPAVQCVPPGFAFAIEQRDGAEVCVFSDVSLQESASGA